jgi:hypothetical protein
MFHEIRLTLASGIVDRAGSVKTNISQFCNYFFVDVGNLYTPVPR